MSEAVQIQNVTNAVKLIVDGKGGRFEVPPQGTVVVLGDLAYFKKCIVKGMRGIVVKKYTGTKIPLLESKVSEEPVSVDITNKTKILKIMVLGTGDRIELYPGETKRVVAKPSVVKIRGVEVRRVKKLSRSVPPLTPPVAPPPAPKLVPVIPPVTFGASKARIEKQVNPFEEFEAKKQQLLAQQEKALEQIPTQGFDGTSNIITGGVSDTMENIDESEVSTPNETSQAGIEMQASDPENRPVWEQLELPETEQEFRDKVNSGEYGMLDLRGIGNHLKPVVGARSIKTLTEKIVAVVYSGNEKS